MVQTDHDSLDVLDRTIWGEVRGGPFEGKVAVAHVILNRLAESKAYRKKYKKVHWQGETIADICKKKWQFSCWNPNDPNYKKLLKVNETDSVFVICGAASRGALSGIYPDPTAGATHYHTKAVKPTWAVGQTPTAKIGQHIFYKDIL